MGHPMGLVGTTFFRCLQRGSGRGYKTIPKWGIKPPRTPLLAIFDLWGGFFCSVHPHVTPGVLGTLWGGFMPPGGVLSPPFYWGGGVIPSKGWFYPPKGVVLSPPLGDWGRVSPLWGGFIPPFRWFYPPIGWVGGGLSPF